MSWLLDVAWWLVEVILNYARENPGKTLIFIVVVLRMFGTTVQTGWKGVLFSFGRVRRELDPGFHFLIPFMQKVRKTPIRSVTLHLRMQRITTADGLVYDVQANVIYRVAEPMKALVLVDDLRKGFEAVLPIIVQELLRGKTRAELQERKGLDEEFTVRAEAKLQRWGVTVEQAGFMTIAPTKKTLRLTQLSQLTAERERVLVHYREQGLTPEVALALLGSERRPTGRAASRYRARSRQVIALRRAYLKAFLAEERARIFRELVTPGQSRLITMVQEAAAEKAVADPAVAEMASARARRFSRLTVARRPRHLVPPAKAEDAPQGQAKAQTID